VEGHVSRVGQNRISAPYMTVCMVISLLNCMYAVYTYKFMVLANPTRKHGPVQLSPRQIISSLLQL
jgi:hypothetical protein